MRGQETVSVGAKSRLVFPSLYRDHFKENLILTFGFENSLIATGESFWNEFVQKEVGNKSFLHEEVRDLRRFFLGGTTTIEFDEQGRFILPEYLREYAKITSGEKAVFVWQKEYIEIWSEALWKDKQKQLLSNIGNIATALQKKENNG